MIGLFAGIFCIEIGKMIENMPNNFSLQTFYEKIGLELSNFQVEAESSDYAAATFLLNDFKIRYREAKITPTKIGQFVTLWKRNSEGITAPFHVEDDLDFAIISVQKDDNLGQFIFPKTILHEKGILADHKKDGKRGFRVYPPWDIAENKQAKQTQTWQLQYFFEISAKTDIAKMKIFFQNNQQ
jgi:hypothetical protein